ncbi:MAG: hypothetical protein HYV07_08765 [Deltaproteobacteria bacterium]|nr:hypothetical protein [Deltaproteobacteria bacterium]
MEPVDLTVEILRQIRDELRLDREQNAAFRDEQRQFAKRQLEFNERQLEFNEQQRQFNEQALLRFEHIETAVRDMAEQLVMLARGVKVAIESRSKIDDRVDALEQRVAILEKSA